MCMQHSSTPLAILFSLAVIAVAAKPVAADECWLGERFGIKAVNYTLVKESSDLRKSCRTACAADAGNALQICHRLGAPYVNNAEFGCFFREADRAAELLLSPPESFYGCTELCECPEGQWYEAFRRRCAEPTGTEVPNMPNGDKGGGYYVKDGYLFKDADQPACHMLPAGQPTTSARGAVASGRWTEWMSIDTPGGHGDIERIDAYITYGKVCAKPIDVQCRTKAGIDWLETGQVYTCDRIVGGVCTNFTQKDGDRCLDYEVRFLCP